MANIALLPAIDQDAIANFPKSFSQEMLEAACIATSSFLNQCKFSWFAKQLPKVERDDANQRLGWNGYTANSYAKIWQWISDLRINTFDTPRPKGAGILHS